MIVPERQITVVEAAPSEQIPDGERFRPERVALALQSRGIEGLALPGVDEIIEHLARHRTGSDVALIMSNGAFGNIWERLLARLGPAD